MEDRIRAHLPFHSIHTVTFRHPQPPLAQPITSPVLFGVMSTAQRLANPGADVHVYFTWLTSLWCMLLLYEVFGTPLVSRPFPMLSQVLPSTSSDGMFFRGAHDQWWLPFTTGLH